MARALRVEYPGAFYPAISASTKGSQEEYGPRCGDLSPATGIHKHEAGIHIVAIVINNITAAQVGSSLRIVYLHLEEWKHIMDILGRDWDFIATDKTDSKLGGNGERMTFVYDKRKVWFQNIAGEIVLPPNMLISKAEFEVSGKKVTAGNQFKRTPFIASFQSG